MTTTATRTDEASLCARCLCAQPASEFRRRRKGDPKRQRTCRACHAETERLRRAACREQRDQDTIRRFVHDVRAADTSDHIGLLVAKIERELGGPEQLAQAWVSHFHAANRKGGSKRVLDFFAAVLRLSVACAELRPKPDYDAMTDQELTQALDRLVAEYLTDNLPKLIETMSAHGWTILPPGDGDAFPHRNDRHTAESLA